MKPVRASGSVVLPVAARLWRTTVTVPLRVTLICLSSILLASGGVGCTESDDSSPSPERVLASESMSAPAAEEVRRACLDSLRRLQERVRGIVRQHPESLSHLGEGVLDEKQLSLHFDVVDPAHRPHELVGVTLPDHLGLYFQSVPETTGGSLPAPRCHWPLIDVSFRLTWMWANKRFDLPLQNALEVAVAESCRELDALEARALRAALTGRGEAPFVYRGVSTLRITIEPTRQADGRLFIKIFQTNAGSNDLQLCRGYTELAVNGATQVMLAPGYLLTVQKPFRTLEPGQVEEIAQWELKDLAPGENRVRVVMSYPYDSYIDTTPTAYDGVPELRRLDHAWTGASVSNELTVTVAIRQGSEP